MEYGVGKKARVFALVSSALFVIMGLCGIINSFVPPADRSDTLVLVAGVLMTLMGVYFWLETLRSKLIIDPQRVSMQHAFHTRSLHRDDIAGYRYVTHNRDRIRIVPNRPGLKKIDVPVLMPGRQELLAWLARFPNLDAADYRAASNAIFSNEQFGATEAERLDYLRKAKRMAQAANAVGLLGMLWLWIWPRPYDTAMISGFLLPWLAIWLAWRYKGLLRQNAEKGSPYPSLIGILFLPVAGLMLRIIWDYKIYQASSVWLPLLITAAPIVAIFLYTGAKAFAPARAKAAGQVVLGLTILAYSFTLLVFTNCYYNASPPQVFTVNVKGKHFEKDKTTTYYLTLAAWGRFTTEQDEEVKAELYNRVIPGREVHVYLLAGKWKIPWYFITE